jgi:hypothetical protein
VIVLEFVAAIVFAITVANIISVVTSMDTNARNTAEQLNAVNSFIRVRKFPEEMARKISRHFRHFYSRKNAIDEAKIFAELSTGLRNEVSSFLVEDLLGKESFFMTMPPTLWPRLLPLLKPMGFEASELVCTQGDDCTEMLVVVSGMLVGECRVAGEPMPRKRHVCVGGSVNTLRCLNIWAKCLETVKAQETSESYAITAHDVITLFPTESDKAVFDTMQSREVKHFKMDKKAAAPTEWGKPLYFSCFSVVKVSLVEIAGRFRRNKPSNNFDAQTTPFDDKGSEAYLVVDLVDIISCKPFNGYWRHSTAKGYPTLSSCSPKIKRRSSLKFGFGNTTFAVEELAVVETIRWDDVNVPISQAAVRVRLFLAHSGGRPAECVGRVTQHKQ